MSPKCPGCSSLAEHGKIESMNKTTPPVPAPQKKKNKGLIIGLIVGLAIFIVASFIFATVALVAGGNLFKDLKIEGSGNPDSNTALKSSVESYPGVEKATINCSTPVPWDFQNCVLNIEVARTATEAELKDVAGAFIESVTNGDLGSTPRGIVLSADKDKYNSARLESTTIRTTETLDSAVPLFFRAIQDPSVTGLTTGNYDYKTGRDEYTSVSISAVPDYTASCAKAQSFATAVGTIYLQHDTLASVTLGDMSNDPSGTLVCAQLLRFVDSHESLSSEIRSLSAGKAVVKITFEPGTNDATKASLRSDLEAVLTKINYTLAL